MSTRKRNSFVKGELFEQETSCEFHQNKHCIPILVSDKFLRRRGAGQVDMCRLLKIKNDFILEILEVKSSSLPSKLQYQRLVKSSSLLSNIMKVSSTISLDMKSSHLCHF